MIFIVELETENGIKEVVPVSVAVSLSVLADHTPKAPSLLIRLQSVVLTHLYFRHKWKGLHWLCSAVCISVRRMEINVSLSPARILGS